MLNCNNSVDLHDTVYLPDKPETSKEPDRSRKQIKEDNHDKRVPKVQECRRGIFNLQLSEEVMTAVQKQVNGGKSRC